MWRELFDRAVHIVVVTVFCGVAILMLVGFVMLEAFEVCRPGWGK